MMKKALFLAIIAISSLQGMSGQKRTAEYALGEYENKLPRLSKEASCSGGILVTIDDFSGFMNASRTLKHMSDCIDDDAPLLLSTINADTLCRLMKLIKELTLSSHPLTTLSTFLATCNKLQIEQLVDAYNFLDIQVQGIDADQLITFLSSNTATSLDCINKDIQELYDLSHVQQQLFTQSQQEFKKRYPNQQVRLTCCQPVYKNKIYPKVQLFKNILYIKSYDDTKECQLIDLKTKQLIFKGAGFKAIKSSQSNFVVLYNPQTAEIKVFNCAAKKEVATFIYNAEKLRVMHIDDKQIIFYENDGWDTVKNNTILIYNYSTNEVSPVKFDNIIYSYNVTPSGSHLIVNGDQDTDSIYISKQTHCIYNIATGEKKFIYGHTLNTPVIIDAKYLIFSKTKEMTPDIQIIELYNMETQESTILEIKNWSLCVRVKVANNCIVMWAEDYDDSVSNITIYNYHTLNQVTSVAGNYSHIKFADNKMLLQQHDNYCIDVYNLTTAIKEESLQFNQDYEFEQTLKTKNYALFKTQSNEFNRLGYFDCIVKNLVTGQSTPTFAYQEDHLNKQIIQDDTLVFQQNNKLIAKNLLDGTEYILLEANQTIASFYIADNNNIVIITLDCTIEIWQPELQDKPQE